MTEVPGYIQRLRERDARAALNRQIVFGLVVSFVLFAVAAMKRFLVIHALDAVWSVVMMVGALLLLVTLLLPSAWSIPERKMRWLSNAVGHLVFVAILGIIYFIFFWPAGWLLRSLKGTHPFYNWDKKPPADAEGWTKKDVVTSVGRAWPAGHRLRLLLQPIAVLGFFLRRQALLVPVLILLLALGLLLLFVQTSALAPFIYTIF